MDTISDNLYGNYHSYYWEEEAKLLNLVNDARRKNGARELKYDADLNALCEIKMLEKSIYGMETFGQQIHVDGKRDLVLIPREGDEKFLFGQPEDIEDKFRKMEKYYTHIIPAKGEGAYKTVDLKYRGQIVCREK
jgi:hypothetical protein